MSEEQNIQGDKLKDGSRKPDQSNANSQEKNDQAIPINHPQEENRQAQTSQPTSEIQTETMEVHKHPHH